MKGALDTLEVRDDAYTPAQVAEFRNASLGQSAIEGMVSEYDAALLAHQIGGRLELVEAVEEDDPLWWKNYGRCVGMPVDMFFPDQGGDSQTPKDICNGGCPVKDLCLEYALVNSEQFGIWGGTSDRQRRALRKNRNAALRAAAAHDDAATEPDAEKVA